jgi:group I intron endonuclease
MADPKETVMDIPPRASGIYQLRCLPTGKVYVGKATNLGRRWSFHRRHLNQGRHYDPHLQAAWDLFGEESFEFSVVALVQPADLLNREQVWTEATGCTERQKGFNLLEIAGAPGAAHVKVWEGFVDPNGAEVTITNLHAFCAQHNLDSSSMIRLAQGKSKLKSYKGWSHRNSVRTRPHVKTYDGFIDPHGHRVDTITNLAAFCREHSLEPAHMVAVAHGRLCSHRGWTYDTGRARQVKRHRGFVSPDGQPVEIVNLSAFCREHGLGVVHMHNLKSGIRRSHNGWTWRAPDDPAT